MRHTTSNTAHQTAARPDHQCKPAEVVWQTRERVSSKSSDAKLRTSLHGRVQRSRTGLRSAGRELKVWNVLPGEEDGMDASRTADLLLVRSCTYPVASRTVEGQGACGAVARVPPSARRVSREVVSLETRATQSHGDGRTRARALAAPRAR